MAATTDLALAVDFIHDRFADDLTDFDHYHRSVEDMIHHLAGVDLRRQHRRLRRSPRLPDCLASLEERVQYCRKLEPTSHHHQRHRSAVCFLLFHASANFQSG